MVKEDFEWWLNWGGLSAKQGREGGLKDKMPYLIILGKWSLFRRLIRKLLLSYIDVILKLWVFWRYWVSESYCHGNCLQGVLVDSGRSSILTHSVKLLLVYCFKTQGSVQDANNALFHSSTTLAHLWTVFVHLSLLLYNLYLGRRGHPYLYSACK